MTSSSRPGISGLPPPRPSPKSQSTAASRTAAEPADPALVLVVDDDPSIRSLSAEFVQALGYRTVEASTGPEALQALRDNGEIDLLFADIAMPMMNGFELAERAGKVRPGLPVLLMTGFAEFNPPGADDRKWPVLEKPYSLTDLEPALARLLNGKSAGHS